MGELTDFIALILGKVGSWFNCRGQRICFVLWTICVLYWMVRDYNLGLMVQTCGCFLTLSMHLYGWWNWKAKGIGT